MEYFYVNEDSSLDSSQNIQVEAQETITGVTTKSFDKRRNPILKGYNFLEEIGRGSSGIVYKVLHKHSNSLYAMKEIRMPSDVTVS